MKESVGSNFAQYLFMFRIYIRHVSIRTGRLTRTACYR